VVGVYLTTRRPLPTSQSHGRSGWLENELVRTPFRYDQTENWNCRAGGAFR